MENNFENTKWEYIVYETTNLINGKIYIGVHKTKDQSIFDGYIGCGVYVSQPYTYQYAKTAFQYAVKKYGPENFRRKTISIFETEQQAYDLEAEIVNEAFLKRDDVYNMVLGGCGGCLASERIKVYQYDLDGNFIQEYKSMADAAASVDASNYTLISYAVRKKSIAKKSLWSTDKMAKLNLDDYNLGTNHKKEVSVYLKTGEYIDTCESIASASKKYNVCSGAISKSCILGICVHNEYYFNFLKFGNYDKAKTEYIKNRPVYQYYGDTGKFYMEYKSQADAEKENPGSNISKSIRLKKADDNNWMWSIERFDEFNTPSKRRMKKSVGKFSVSGEMVAIYPSATSAAKENGSSVWKVLSGINQTHKGYIYKYLKS